MVHKLTSLTKIFLHQLYQKHHSQSFSSSLLKFRLNQHEALYILEHYLNQSLMRCKINPRNQCHQRLWSDGFHIHYRKQIYVTKHSKLASACGEHSLLEVALVAVWMKTRSLYKFYNKPVIDQNFGIRKNFVNL